MVHFGQFAGIRELALFAGAGGGLLGEIMLGWRTVCAVEIEKYPRNILLQRQRDGILDNFPIWDDVRTFDGKPWRGKVDVISGGFPCQDISSAGRGLGIERGERSGLWRECARIIREVRPRYCFVENSPILASRGLGIVLGDLAEAGYDAAWKVLSAGDYGAPHERKRMWIVGKISDTDCLRKQQSQRNISEVWRRAVDVCEEVAYADMPHGESFVHARQNESHSLEKQIGELGFMRGSLSADGFGRWWSSEPGLGRVADGMANRVDRIKAIGNGQVPLVAARAFCELIDELEKNKGHINDSLPQT